MLETKWIPAQEAGAKNLLIVLHGLGDSMAGYSWVPQALRFPWLNYLLVNAPDEYYGGFSWYDYAGDATTGVRRSISLLHPLLSVLLNDSMYSCIAQNYLSTICRNFTNFCIPKFYFLCGSTSLRV